MAVDYVEGNIFESKADVILVTVNTVGVMGKGQALEFKQTVPGGFLAYKELCNTKALKPGFIEYWKSDAGQWYGFAATKQHWRNPSELDCIENILIDLLEVDPKLSVALPKLGCGNGGLNWDSQVKPLVEKYLGPTDQQFIVHV